MRSTLAHICCAPCYPWLLHTSVLCACLGENTTEFSKISRLFQIKCIWIYIWIYISKIFGFWKGLSMPNILFFLWYFFCVCVFGLVFFFVEKQNIESMGFKKKARALTWRKTITNIKEFFVLMKIKVCFLAKTNCSFCEWTYTYKMFKRISSVDGNEMNQLSLPGQNLNCILMVFQLLWGLKNQTVSHLNTSWLLSKEYCYESRVLSDLSANSLTLTTLLQYN